MSVVVDKDTGERVKCLNPCCNGIYSMRVSMILLISKLEMVLILVVMEYTQ